MKRATATGLVTLIVALLLAVPGAAGPRPKRGTVAPVLLVSRPWPPVVTVRVHVASGALVDPPGKEGLALLAWTLALRGAGSRDRGQFAEALDSLGASVDASVDRYVAALVGAAPVAELPALLGLMADVLHSPRFDAEEFSKVRQQLVDDLLHLRDDEEALVHDAIGRYVFRGTVLGRPGQGTEQSLKRLDVADVQAFWHKNIANASLRFGLAGALTQAQAQAAVQGAFASVGTDHPASPPPIGKIAVQGRRMLLLDKPRKAQAQIVLAWPTVGAQHKDAVAMAVANAILGGAFTSRLTHEIRELRGWAYHTWSALGSGPTVSSWALGFGTSAQDAAPAVDVAIQILQEMHEQGVTPQELRFAKDFLKGGQRYALETAAMELAVRMRAADMGLPASDVDYWPQRIESVDLKTVNRVLHERMQPDHLAAVVVGTASQLLGPLQSGRSQFGVEVKPADSAPEATTMPGQIVGKRPPPVLEEAPRADQDAEPMSEPPEEGDPEDAEDAP